MTGKPEQLYSEALEAAREALSMMDAEGEVREGYTEDEVANAEALAGDRLVAWVGMLDGHPWYCRG